MCVRIGESPALDVSAMRQNYVSPEFLEDQAMADPFEQVWCISICDQCFGLKKVDIWSVIYFCSFINGSMMQLLLGLGSRMLWPCQLSIKRGNRMFIFMFMFIFRFVGYIYSYVYYVYLCLYLLLVFMFMFVYDYDCIYVYVHSCISCCLSYSLFLPSLSLFLHIYISFSRSSTLSLSLSLSIYIYIYI